METCRAKIKVFFSKFFFFFFFLQRGQSFIEKILAFVR